ncbi:winged helix-turn-helix domain-containing protein [Ornithinicoccus halotolerans]|uniref:winged helix-turn-helix domain-containing protein n=1 Tax=Ornithinicoccus halotolerans TaxID=1748220 RepID=UPI0012967CB1|nr:crosslink repair DNA glycosylase YcaQ family protein [Ornithinicoccus halotolerans]
MPTPTLTLAQARRIALAAQGFAEPRRTGPGPAGSRAVQRVVDRVRTVQVDSVNVLARSHYLPFYSRLGAYDTAALDRLRDGPGPRSRRPRRLVEYWGHAASLLPVETWPHLGFRMRRFGEHPARAGFAREHAAVLEQVREVVTTHPPLTAREVEAVLEHDAPRRRDHWGWNWSLVKQCLEHLFGVGAVTSSGRNQHFERRYADLSWVLPPAVAARAPGRAGAPTEEESALELVRQSVRAHGVGTEADVRDYFRLQTSMVRPALAELVRRGEVEQVQVAGWPVPAYLDAAARRPRRVQARALLSPFDSLVWERQRTESLFGFRYRIEIYVPEPQRVHGYYVLPFLWGERLVGRVDLKADRGSGRLVVRRAGFEPDAPAGAQQALAEELGVMAGWMGLAEVHWE